MSNKERIIQLIDNVSESKLVYVVNILESLQAYASNDTVEEAVADEIDIQMIAEAEKINDGQTVSLDELLKRDGLTYADL